MITAFDLHRALKLTAEQTNLSVGELMVDLDTSVLETSVGDTLNLRVLADKINAFIVANDLGTPWSE